MWPDWSTMTGCFSMQTVPSTRPAMVSGSSAVMSPVIVIDGPICETDDMGAPLAPGNGKDRSVGLARNSPGSAGELVQKAKLNHEFDGSGIDEAPMTCRRIGRLCRFFDRREK